MEQVSSQSEALRCFILDLYEQESKHMLSSSNGSGMNSNEHSQTGNDNMSKYTIQYISQDN
jgi:hypothetical protein